MLKCKKEKFITKPIKDAFPSLLESKKNPIRIRTLESRMVFDGSFVELIDPIETEDTEKISFFETNDYLDQQNHFTVMERDSSVEKILQAIDSAESLQKNAIIESLQKYAKKYAIESKKIILNDSSVYHFQKADFFASKEHFKTLTDSLDIVIQGLPSVGVLQFKGQNIVVDQKIPFDQVEELSFFLPDYSKYDRYRFSSSFIFDIQDRENADADSIPLKAIYIVNQESHNLDQLLHVSRNILDYKKYVEIDKVNTQQDKADSLSVPVHDVDFKDKEKVIFLQEIVTSPQHEYVFSFDFMSKVKHINYFASLWINNKKIKTVQLTNDLQSSTVQFNANSQYTLIKIELEHEAGQDIKKLKNKGDFIVSNVVLQEAYIKQHYGIPIIENIILGKEADKEKLLKSVSVSLVDPQKGDRLTVRDFKFVHFTPHAGTFVFNSHTIGWRYEGNSVFLHGVASVADYAKVLYNILFENVEAYSSQKTRTISITIDDGLEVLSSFVSIPCFPLSPVSIVPDENVNSITENIMTVKPEYGLLAYLDQNNKNDFEITSFRVSGHDDIFSVGERVPLSDDSSLTVQADGSYVFTSKEQSDALPQIHCFLGHKLSKNDIEASNIEEIYLGADDAKKDLVFNLLAMRKVRQMYRDVNVGDKKIEIYENQKYQFSYEDFLLEQKKKEATILIVEKPTFGKLLLQGNLVENGQKIDAINIPDLTFVAEVKKNLTPYSFLKFFILEDQHDRIFTETLSSIKIIELGVKRLPYFSMDISRNLLNDGKCFGTKNAWLRVFPDDYVFDEEKDRKYYQQLYRYFYPEEAKNIHQGGIYTAIPFDSSGVCGLESKTYDLIPSYITQEVSTIFDQEYVLSLDVISDIANIHDIGSIWINNVRVKIFQAGDKWEPVFVIFQAVSDVTYIQIQAEGSEAGTFSRPNDGRGLLVSNIHLERLYKKGDAPMNIIEKIEMNRHDSYNPKEGKELIREYEVHRKYDFISTDVLPNDLLESVEIRLVNAEPGDILLVEGSDQDWGRIYQADFLEYENKLIFWHRENNTIIFKGLASFEEYKRAIKLIDFFSPASATEEGKDFGIRKIEIIFHDGSQNSVPNVVFISVANSHELLSTKALSLDENVNNSIQQYIDKNQKIDEKELKTHQLRLILSQNILQSEYYLKKLDWCHSYSQSGIKESYDGTGFYNILPPENGVVCMIESSNHDFKNSFGRALKQTIETIPGRKYSFSIDAISDLSNIADQGSLLVNGENIRTIKASDQWESFSGIFKAQYDSTTIEIQSGGSEGGMFPLANDGRGLLVSNLKIEPIYTKKDKPFNILQKASIQMESILNKPKTVTSAEVQFVNFEILDRLMFDESKDSSGTFDKKKNRKFAWTIKDSNIVISGLGNFADYEQLLSLIKFSTPSQILGQETREFNIKIFDQENNVASASSRIRLELFNDKEFDDSFFVKKEQFFDLVYIENYPSIQIAQDVQISAYAKGIQTLEIKLLNPAPGDRLFVRPPTFWESVFQNKIYNGLTVHNDYIVFLCSENPLKCKTGLDRVQFENILDNPQGGLREILMTIYYDDFKHYSSFFRTIEIIPILDHPFALDDYVVAIMNTKMEVQKENGLLSNDYDKDLDELQIVKITVDGLDQTFFPGERIDIDRICVLQIEKNGSYIFNPYPNFAGTVPEITYYMSDGVFERKAKFVIEVKNSILSPLYLLFSQQEKTFKEGLDSSKDVPLIPSDLEHAEEMPLDVVPPISVTADELEENKRSIEKEGLDSRDISVNSSDLEHAEEIPLDIVPPSHDGYVVAAMNTKMEVQQENGLLPNDHDKNLNKLEIFQITVDGLDQTFFPGETINIDGICFLQIEKNGSYIFNPYPEFAGYVPEITYYMTDGLFEGEDKLIIEVKDKLPISSDLEHTEMDWVNHFSEVRLGVVSNIPVTADELEPNETLMKSEAMDSNSLQDSVVVDGSDASVVQPLASKEQDSSLNDGFLKNVWNKYNQMIKDVAGLFALGGQAKIEGISFRMVAPNIPVMNDPLKLDTTLMEEELLDSFRDISVTILDRPVAFDDYVVAIMNIKMEVQQENGLLSNDYHKDVDQFQIVKITVDGLDQTFFPGERIDIDRICVLQIEKNGSYLFNPYPNFAGTVPEITYYMTDGILEMKAKLLITVKDKIVEEVKNNILSPLYLMSSRREKVLKERLDSSKDDYEHAEEMQLDVAPNIPVTSNQLEADEKLMEPDIDFKRLKESFVMHAVEGASLPSLAPNIPVTSNQLEADEKLMEPEVMDSNNIHAFVAVDGLDESDASMAKPITRALLQVDEKLMEPDINLNRLKDSVSVDGLDEGVVQPVASEAQDRPLNDGLLQNISNKFSYMKEYVKGLFGLGHEAKELFGLGQQGGVVDVTLAMFAPNVPAIPDHVEADKSSMEGEALDSKRKKRSVSVDGLDEGVVQSVASEAQDRPLNDGFLQNISNKFSYMKEYVKGLFGLGHEAKELFGLGQQGGVVDVTLAMFAPNVPAIPDHVEADKSSMEQESLNSNRKKRSVSVDGLDEGVVQSVASEAQDRPLNDGLLQNISNKFSYMKEYVKGLYGLGHAAKELFGLGQQGGVVDVTLAMFAPNVPAIPDHVEADKSSMEGEALDSKRKKRSVSVDGLDEGVVQSVASEAQDRPLNDGLLQNISNKFSYMKEYVKGLFGLGHEAKELFGLGQQGGVVDVTLAMFAPNVPAIPDHVEADKSSMEGEALDSKRKKRSVSVDGLDEGVVQPVASEAQDRRLNDGLLQNISNKFSYMKEYVKGLFGLGHEAKELFGLGQQGGVVDVTLAMFAPNVPAIPDHVEADKSSMEGEALDSKRKKRSVSVDGLDEGVVQPVASEAQDRRLNDGLLQNISNKFSYMKEYVKGLFGLGHEAKELFGLGQQGGVVDVTLAIFAPNVPAIPDHVEADKSSMEGEALDSKRKKRSVSVDGLDEGVVQSVASEAQDRPLNDGLLQNISNKFSYMKEYVKGLFGLGHEAKELFGLGSQDGIEGVTLAMFAPNVPAIPDHVEADKSSMEQESLNSNRKKRSVSVDGLDEGVVQSVASEAQDRPLNDGLLQNISNKFSYMKEYVKGLFGLGHEAKELFGLGSQDGIEGVTLAMFAPNVRIIADHVEADKSSMERESLNSNRKKRSVSVDDLDGLDASVVKPLVSEAEVVMSRDPSIAMHEMKKPAPLAQGKQFVSNHQKLLQQTRDRMNVGSFKNEPVYNIPSHDAFSYVETIIGNAHSNIIGDLLLASSKNILPLKAFDFQRLNDKNIFDLILPFEKIILKKSLVHVPLFAGLKFSNVENGFIRSIYVHFKHVFYGDRLEFLGKLDTRNCIPGTKIKVRFTSESIYLYGEGSPQEYADAMAYIHFNNTKKSSFADRSFFLEINSEVGSLFKNIVLSFAEEAKNSLEESEQFFAKQVQD